MFGLTIGRVRGLSMVPRVLPDSFILAFLLPRWLRSRSSPLLSSVHIGCMYYLNHPRYGYIVKTLAAVNDGVYYFRGESNDSVSSEEIGALYDEHIIGRVVWVVSPKADKGR